MRELSQALLDILIVGITFVGANALLIAIASLLGIKPSYPGAAIMLVISVYIAVRVADARLDRN